MRPGVSLDSNAAEPLRPRKSSNADASSLTSERDRCTNTAATTFFLSRDPDGGAGPQQAERASTTMLYNSPLSSLQDTVQEADRAAKHVAPRSARSGSRRRSTIRPGTAGRFIRRGSSDASADAETCTSQPPQSTLSDKERTRAITPSPLPSRETSLPSSPKSPASRQSLSKSSSASDNELLTSADETDSQAVLSSGEEDENEYRPTRSPTSQRLRLPFGEGIHDSHPELIMPSIKMPSRRPFTQRGKRLGRFKIMVAGRKGIGKTSLIKSIVQLCEDIVHVDPIVSAPGSSHPSTRGRDQINEVYASTKPYPEWWSTMEESRILRRRKSMGDSVLERNICFVDTSDTARLERVIQYAEMQLVNAMSSVDQLGSEFSGLLSGRGASQVDVILYLISKDNLQDDAQRIRQLSDLCNVIPLIAKSDLLSPQEQDQLKQSLDPSLSSLPRLPSSVTFSEAVTATVAEPNRILAAATAPYTVTSTNGPDLDTMDASLLMSPEYIQPLLPSELSLLIDQIFEPDTIAYLRHNAARKLVSWHVSHPKLVSAPRSPSIASSPPQSYNPSVRNSILTSPLQTPLSPSQSGVLIPGGSEFSLNTSNSWALAKVADHTHREERLAQIRLSKWASELQLSLQRERERYERLARGERAVWLVEKMGEEVRDGKIMPVDNNQALVRKNGKGSITYGDSEAVPSYQMHDPLGLLRWQDSMRARGWIALQIVGSFGVMGGLAFWLAKNLGMTGSIHDWWTQVWDSLGWHEG
ncbi:hypothetical protein A1O7_07368 [Cladophialophora yegresii CBS 114405]|uniref:Septin-type G domain-containing protein n=1 Tax=Cladophialophora yegresii CBS 114405 TaxID=1182544 RepID=W9WES0_9EURO|nr:uncharacterized protein A1O7_07368 [Cladophialophora yegresii CBS 114405]EXJ57024.1 hypothetical protein A1O7_07368 [Cladophialophora yegresii CBS 114405]